MWYVQTLIRKKDTNFSLRISGSKVGRLLRYHLLMDYYQLDLTEDISKEYDHRLVVALAALLVCAEYKKARTFFDMASNSIARSSHFPPV